MTTMKPGNKVQVRVFIIGTVSLSLGYLNDGNWSYQQEKMMKPETIKYRSTTHKKDAPIIVATRSKVPIAFDLTNTGIMGSNPTWGRGYVPSSFLCLY
jgi:hypothetical protein